MTHSNTRQSSVSALFPVPELSGTFQLLCDRFGSCDRILVQKIRTEGYKWLLVLPLKNILNRILAFASPSVVSSNTRGLRFQCCKIIEGVWVPESSLGREAPRRACVGQWHEGGVNLCVRSLRLSLQQLILIVLIQKSVLEMGCWRSQIIFLDCYTIFNIYHWFSSLAIGRKETHIRKWMDGNFDYEVTNHLI